jgi:hypothetical protein
MDKWNSQRCVNGMSLDNFIILGTNIAAVRFNFNLKRRSIYFEFKNGG